MRKSESLKSVFWRTARDPAAVPSLWTSVNACLVPWGWGEGAQKVGVVRPGTSSESSDIVHIESLFFFGISVFLFFVRVHISWFIIFQATKLSRWNRPISTKSASCHPWSSWKKTFMLVDVWRRQLISLASSVCVSWCIQILWSCPMIWIRSVPWNTTAPYSLWRIEWVELEGLRSGMSPKVLWEDGVGYHDVQLAVVPTCS